MTVFFVQFHQHVRRLFAIHQEVKVDRFLQIEFLIQFGYIGRVQLVQDLFDLRVILFIDDVFQVLYVFFRQFNHFSAYLEDEQLALFQIPFRYQRQLHELFYRQLLRPFVEDRELVIGAIFT